MRFRRRALLSLLALAVIAGLGLFRSRGGREVPAGTGVAARRDPAGGPGGVPVPIPSVPPARERELRARLGYGHAWHGDGQPAALVAFREWVDRYRGAAPGDRAALAAEGRGLAQARRGEMRALIVRDPARALAVTVPAALRAELPAEVRAELETRVAGVGEFAWQVICYEDRPRPDAAPTSRRTVFLGAETMTAHAYGRRTGQPTKEGASLHGIVLEGELALHESPLRLLEESEGAAGESPAGRWRVAAQDRVWPIAADGDGVEAIERRLVAAEELPGPRVPAVALDRDEPERAAASPTANTIGAKRVLALRVDFSDVAGEPVGEAALDNTLNGAVRQFFEEASYGLTTLTATVSGKVYRLPRTAASYATANNSSGLHADARALAAADFAVSGYDRVMVVFGNLGTGTGGVAGSQFTWAGLATVGGTNSWINNAANLRTIAHELGHNWGLRHSSTWRVADGNPVSSAGAVLEYGDPWDVMGNNAARDGRHHFNQWCKNQLGWLPDGAVRTVATSGTYRVFRFDAKDAPRTQTQALRFFRDGVRWYWLGYRQNFPEVPTLAGGASILWGFNSVQESALLDCTTPGTTPNDAGLAIGATLDDPLARVKVRPVARGGEAPAEWLDVEITLPAAPPDVAVAWGTGDNFLDTPNSVSSVPPGLVELRALAAGRSHVVALRASRIVTAWGDGVFDQTAVPQINDFVTAVAAGGDVSGAVLSGGTVKLWGAFNSGLLTPPEGLTGVRQLAIGTNHAVALKTDGSLVGWGSNAAGQLALPEGLKDVVQVAAGTQTTVILRGDGTVLALGGAIIRAVPASLAGVVAIAAGGTHGLAVKGDGTVAAWGSNTSGQATVPAGVGNVVAVAAGDSHSLALRADGTVVGWGSTAGGKLAVPSGLPRAHTIAASAQASFALVGPNLYITTPPQSQTVVAGGPATFAVEAVGEGELRYQWRRNGGDIAGATERTLAMASVAAADAGDYTVTVWDGTYTRASVVARLVLAAPPVTPPVVGPSTPASEIRIVNLSILTSVSAAEPSFTVGSVVGGAGTSGTKPLLIRAVGPSLTLFGLTGALTNLRLDVFAGSTPVAGNDDWGGAAALSAAFAGVGAFALAPATSRDAAVLYLASVGAPPASYTMQVSGVGGASGLVLAELYDATTGAFGPTTPRLINVSVLKRIDAGGVLTAGFVISGAGTKQVLIRAVGPTLEAAPFNVPGVMADPRIELFSGVVAIEANDNWGGGATLATAYADVGAFALPLASRDAAIFATLKPGNYTAQVSGVGSSAGRVLVEVYEVDPGGRR